MLLACSVVATLLLTPGALLLTLETDESIFFADDNPNYIAEQALERQYGKADNAFIVIAPKAGTVFTQKTLILLSELTLAGWEMPYSRRVDSLVNFQHTTAEGDDLMVGNLVEDAAALTAADVDRVRAIALDSPELVHRLVSPSGHVAGVNVLFNMPDDDEEAVPEIASEARLLRDRFSDAYPDVDFYLLGSVIGDQTFDELSIDDLFRFIPIVITIVILILTATLRSVSATLAILIVVAVSIGATLGIAGLLGFTLNAATVAVPSIVMTLAVADSVHMLSIFLTDYRRGAERGEAVRNALRTNLQPVLLTSFTTAIGFLGLNYSEVPPFRDLGNIVAIGVVLALLYTLFLLPGILMRLPFRRGSHHSASAMTRLADFLIGRRAPLSAVAFVVAAFFVSFAPRNTLEDDFIEYFSTDLPLRQAADFAIDNLTGPFRVSFSMDTGQPNGISDPEFLATVDAFVRWARTQPEVIYVSSFTETLKRLNMNLHGDDPDMRRLPDRADLAAQYILLYEVSLPFGLDLNNQITFDKSALRVTIAVASERTRGILAFEERAQRWLADNAPALATPGAGSDVSWANIGQRNINTMLVGSILALALITATLIVTLRSLVFGLTSLLPNLLPAAIAFGVWGMAVGHINLAAAVVFSMTIGIVVDDTVYLLTKYLHARRHLGASPEEAMHYSIRTVARALIVTSVTLTAGFLVLATSDFNLNVTSGLMIAIVVTSAVVFDLTLLPALIIAIDKLAGRFTRRRGTELAPP